MFIHASTLHLLYFLLFVNFDEILNCISYNTTGVQIFLINQFIFRN